MATPKELMTLGQEFVQTYNQGQPTECLKWYANEAISVEAVPMQGQDTAEAIGLEAIKGKNQWWESAHEIHSTKAEGPFIHGEDRFSVIFDMDVTHKESAHRFQMRDIGQYQVQNGKIVREEFSYAVSESE